MIDCVTMGEPLLRCRTSPAVFLCCFVAFFFFNKNDHQHKWDLFSTHACNILLKCLELVRQLQKLVFQEEKRHGGILALPHLVITYSARSETAACSGDRNKFLPFM